jgi:hypothetical protein
MKLYFTVACALLYCSLSIAAQTTLKITSPVNKYKAFPGERITVDVSVSGDASVLRCVAVIGELPLVPDKVRYSTPYRFEIQIPEKINPGLYSLVAVGAKWLRGEIYSDPIYLDVGTSAEPVSFTAMPPKLFLQSGGRLSILVFAKLADGSTIDVTRATTTTYESKDPAIATVTQEGSITGISPGRTTVIVNGRLEVPVAVLDQHGH